MIGLLFVLRCIWGLNVIEGETFFVPCSTKDIKCLDGATYACQNLLVRLTFSAQFCTTCDSALYYMFIVEGTAKETKRPIEQNQYSFDPDTKRIKVTNAHTKNEGKYTCVLDDMATESKENRQTSDIVVLVKPEILGIVRESDDFVQNSDLVPAAECKVKAGKPPAKVMWVGENDVQLPRNRFEQEELNRGGGIVVNRLSLRPTKDLNGYQVFCKVKHDLTAYRHSEPVTFNITYAPTNVNIYKQSDNNLICVADANPPASIGWLLNGKNALENAPQIKMQEAANGNYSYRCTARNALGSTTIKTTNTKIMNMRPMGANYTVMIWAISGTVAGLCIIAIVVCRCAFKSAEKSTDLMAWSEPLPVQRVNPKLLLRPSPPRNFPPASSESDSNSGGEIELADGNHDASFIRSDSILQGSFSTSTLPLWRVPNRPISTHNTGGYTTSDIYPAYNKTYRSHADYIPGNSFARSATRDFDLTESATQHFTFSTPRDQPSQIV